MLFTYILNFREGTYISQVEAKSIKDSVAAWIEKLKKDQNIQHLGPKGISEIRYLLLESYNENQPLPIKRLENTWCTSFSIKKGFGLVNIVQTDIQSK